MLFIATIITEILFPINLKTFIISILKSSIDFKTLRIIILVLSIIFLSNLMENKNLLNQLVIHLDRLNLPKKLQFILLPAFIGLLPMPGGALFSAPMVDKAVAKENFSPEQKTFINYWFRHIWEYFLPLYPGVILVSGLFNIPFINFLKYHGIFLLVMLVIGYFIVLKNVKETSNYKKRSIKDIIGIFYTVLPVIIIFFLVFLFKLDTALSVIIACTISIFLYKINFSEVLVFIKKSLKIDMILMILGIFYFKQALQVTGAINLLPEIFPHSNKFAVYSILILLPLISALLTGITIAYVGISFPILSSYFIIGNVVNMPLETLAYVSGFIGVLLSPVHLCLLLTNEYFKSNLMKVYKYLIICGVILFIFLLAYFIFLLKISV